MPDADYVFDTVESPGPVPPNPPLCFRHKLPVTLAWAWELGAECIPCDDDEGDGDEIDPPTEGDAGDRDDEGNDDGDEVGPGEGGVGKRADEDDGDDIPPARVNWTLACADCAVNITRYQATHGIVPVWIPFADAPYEPPCDVFWGSHGCELRYAHGGNHICDCGSTPPSVESLYL